LQNYSGTSNNVSNDDGKTNQITTCKCIYPLILAFVAEAGALKTGN